MVSMKDIASRVGVSVATVSKALNDHSDIGSATKQKVKEAAREMGYYPNASARTLKTNKSQNIGVLFRDEAGNGFTHDFYAGVLDSFKKTLLQLDQTDFTWYVPSHGEPAEEIHETVEMNQIAILSTERSILKALEGGLQLTFSELMKKVADMNEIKMRTPQYLLIGGTIRSYLCSLYGRNKITCGMKDNMLLWSLSEEN